MPNWLPGFGHTMQAVLHWSCPHLAASGNRSQEEIFPESQRERVGGQVLMWPHRQSSVVDCAGVAGMPDLEGGHRENGTV